MAAEDFNLAGGRPVELHFADVAADLHAIGSGIHAQGASDGSRNTDEPFHPAQVVFGAEGNRAAEVCGGIYMGKVAFEDDVLIAANELQDHPGQFSITDKQVGAAAEELVRDVVGVE